MERYLRKKLKNGAFQDVPASRSAAMGKIRGKGNRTTELRLRLALVRAAISGWCLHPELPGRPDFFFRDQGVAIFVDGCFWHGCPRCGHIPRVNRAFWSAKIERNRQRAKRWSRILNRLGLSVLHVWECTLKNDLTLVVNKINFLLSSRRSKFAVRRKD